MFQKNFNIIFILLASHLTLCDAFTEENYSISGYVFCRATGKSMESVNIYLKNTSLGTTSLRTGFYQFKAPAGKYVIVFSMIGYRVISRTIEIRHSNVTISDIHLTPITLTLPAVTIIGMKTDEEERQIASTGNRTLKARNMQHIPFTLNDVNRVLKIVPGVTSNNEKSSEICVRGGTSEENLVLIDGVRFRNPFHLKEVYNTSISMLNLNMIDNVKIYTGGFPAKFGDKMSSVLDIDYRQGNHEQYEHFVELGTMNFNYLVEGPFLNRGRGLLCFNKSYFEIPFNIIEKYNTVPKFYTITAIPEFYDLQFKLNFGHSSLHQFEVFF